MEFNNFIQASIAIPNEHLDYIAGVVESVGGFIRVEKSADEKAVHSQEDDVRKLRILRGSLGLTQTALSERLGIRQGRISDYESGRRPIPVSVRKKLNEFYGDVEIKSEVAHKGESSRVSGDNSMIKRKFFCPRVLFSSFPKVREHTRKGGNFEVNGLLSAHEGKAAMEINRSIVEDRPSFEALCQKIADKGMAQHPYPKVEAHLRNALYYTTRALASQWGLLEVVGVSSYDELPPCFVATIEGRDIVLMNDDSTSAVALLRRAEKITSPLLERLSELAG